MKEKLCIELTATTIAKLFSYEARKQFGFIVTVQQIFFSMYLFILNLEYDVPLDGSQNAASQHLDQVKFLYNILLILFSYFCC